MGHPPAITISQPDTVGFLCKSQFLRSLIAVQTFRLPITSARAGGQCHSHCEASVKQWEPQRGDGEKKCRSRNILSPEYPNPVNPIRLTGVPRFCQMLTDSLKVNEKRKPGKNQPLPILVPVLDRKKKDRKWWMRPYMILISYDVL